MVIIYSLEALGAVILILILLFFTGIWGTSFAVEAFFKENFLTITVVGIILSLIITATYVVPVIIDKSLSKNEKRFHLLPSPAIFLGTAHLLYYVVYALYTLSIIGQEHPVWCFFAFVIMLIIFVIDLIIASGVLWLIESEKKWLVIAGSLLYLLLFYISFSMDYGILNWFRA